MTNKTTVTKKGQATIADAFNAAFAIKKGIKEIYSYDQDFDKLDHKGEA